MEYEKDRSIALKVDAMINPPGGDRTGFILMIFPVDHVDDGMARYIANVAHKDAITLMKSQIDSLKDLERV